MTRAIDETYRRRKYQQEYNEQHLITPVGIKKAIKDISSRVKAVAESTVEYQVGAELPKDELTRLVKDLEVQMKAAAKELEFERAALLRDQIVELRKLLVAENPVVPKEWLKSR
jgi:excinuclease ABC subunit B